MHAPVQRHPTRAEQLDILVSLISDITNPDDRVLDLGCGTSYAAHLLAAYREDLNYTGVDLKPESLTAAAEQFPTERHRWVEGDLMQPDTLAVDAIDFKAIWSCLTFHDLTDEGKQRLIQWATDRLAPDGVLFIYDRIRLTEPSLFPLQQAIWQRIEREHGVAMRSADSFDAYVTDLGTDNRPACLTVYEAWFAGAGLSSCILNLHGNITWMAATRS